MSDVTVLRWAKTDFVALTVGKMPPDVTAEGVQGFTSGWERLASVLRDDIGQVTTRPDRAEADFTAQEWHYVDKDLTDVYRKKCGS